MKPIKNRRTFEEGDEVIVKGVEREGTVNKRHGDFYNVTLDATGEKKEKNVFAGDMVKASVELEPELWNDVYNNILESVVDSYYGDPEAVDSDLLYSDVQFLVKEYCKDKNEDEIDSYEMEKYIKNKLDYDDYLPDEIESSTQIKSSVEESGRYEIYYNTNNASYTRGWDLDYPNRQDSFDSIDEIATWMYDNNCGYGLVDENEQPLPNLTLDDLVEAANNADISGGDTAVFSFEDFETGEKKYTQWNPDDFGPGEMDEDGMIMASKKQIKSAKSEEDFQDAISELEMYFEVNAEGNMFPLGRRVNDWDYMYAVDDICRKHNVRFVDGFEMGRINPSYEGYGDHTYFVINSSKQIKSTANISKLNSRSLTNKQRHLIHWLREKGIPFEKMVVFGKFGSKNNIPIEVNDPNNFASLNMCDIGIIDDTNTITDFYDTSELKDNRREQLVYGYSRHSTTNSDGLGESKYFTLNTENSLVEDEVTSSRQIKSAKHTSDDLFDLCRWDMLEHTVFLDRDQCKESKLGMSDLIDLLNEVAPYWQVLIILRSLKMFVERRRILQQRQDLRCLKLQKIMHDLLISFINHLMFIRRLLLVTIWTTQDSLHFQKLHSIFLHCSLIFVLFTSLQQVVSSIHTMNLHRHFMRRQKTIMMTL